MSFAKVIRGQGATQITTLNGNLDFNASGDVNFSKAPTFTDASNTRSNLGLAIGSDVQAYDASLADLAAASPSEGQVLKYVGSSWVADDDSSNTYTAGDGLALNSGVFSVDSSLASSGLVYSSGSIYVNVDDTSISVNGSNRVHVKDSGIDTAQIADDAVTGAKIPAGVELEAPSIDNGIVYKSGSANSLFTEGCTYFTTSDSTQSNQTLETLNTGDRCFFEVYAVAKDQVNGECAAYKAEFLAQNDAGTASILSATNVSVIHEDDSSWSFDCDADGANVRVNLVGDSANSVQWTVTSKKVFCK